MQKTSIVQMCVKMKGVDVEAWNYHYTSLIIIIVVFQRLRRKLHPLIHVYSSILCQNGNGDPLITLILHTSYSPTSFTN
jgi:hypothetical protein